MIITAQKSEKKSTKIRYTKVSDLKSPYPLIREIVKQNFQELDISTFGEDRMGVSTETKVVEHIHQMISGHKTLGDYLKERKINIFSGIKTGCNEVFYVTRRQRDEFIAKDPNCSELLVPMLQGKDIQPRRATAHNGTWLKYYPKMQPNDRKLGNPD